MGLLWYNIPMIHPAFEPLRKIDEYAAESFSEMASPDYTAVTKGETGSRFPTEPTHFGMVFASYLKPKNDAFEVKRQYLVMNPDLIPAIKLGSMYTNLAGEVVRLSRSAFANDNLVQNRYIEMVLADNRRLLVAYAAGKVARTGKLTDAIVYPKKVMRELPLEFREIAESVVLEAEATGREISGEDREKMEILLAQQAAAKTLGLLAAATFLPTARQFLDRYKPRQF